MHNTRFLTTGLWVFLSGTISNSWAADMSVGGISLGMPLEEARAKAAARIEPGSEIRALNFTDQPINVIIMDPGPKSIFGTWYLLEAYDGKIVYFFYSKRYSPGTEPLRSTLIADIAGRLGKTEDASEYNGFKWRWNAKGELLGVPQTTIGGAVNPILKCTNFPAAGNDQRAGDRALSIMGGAYNPTCYVDAKLEFARREPRDSIPAPRPELAMGFDFRMGNWAPFNAIGAKYVAQQKAAQKAEEDRSKKVASPF